MGKRLTYLAALVLVLGLIGSANADLVGHWKLDDGAGTTAVDSSGNGHDGELIGNPQWVAGVYGGGLQFAGTPDKVDIPHSPQLNPADEYTASLWANVDPSGSGHRSPITSRDDGPQKGYIIYVDPGNTWQFWTGPGWDNLAGPAVDLGEWTHVAITYANGAKKLYVNGEVVAEGNATMEINEAQVLRIGAGATEGDGNYFFVGILDDVAVFDHALTDQEIVKAMAGIGGDELAGDPSPEDAAADVPRDAVLTWAPGEFAVAHDVYFGTVFDDVNDADRANPMGVLVSEGQAVASYDPDGLLDFGQTYYWRIDEVNGTPDNTIFKGDVWTLTIEPVGYAIEGVVATSNGATQGEGVPENVVNGSGLNENDEHSTESSEMWLASPADEPLYIEFAFDRVYKMHELLVWNYNVQFELLLGFGVKDVTVEYSENGVDWAVLGDVELGQGTARADYTANTAIDLQGVPAQYVRLTVNGGFGMMGQYGLSEVRFLSIPAQAREPQPADAAAGIAVDTMLSWRAGREAVSHDVSLGLDPNALDLVDTVTETSYMPSDLEFGATYYWRIDEVNEADEVSVWQGASWSFATQEYAVIDDMESYDDEENRIYETWIDGFGVDENGSQVGYLEAPFAETAIVNSGGQSMPLLYDNTGSARVSEAVRDLGGQNWDTNGADTLVVNFRGHGPEFLETEDGRILMNSIGADVWGTADQFRYAYKQLSGNGSIIARVDNVVNSWGWAKAGVMIREGLDAGSAHALVGVTPGNGVALQYRPVMNQNSFNVNEPGLVAPYWVKLTRSGNTFTAERSEDGVTWVSITDDAAASTVEIEMGADVYIGLMSVSTRANIVGGATFSNIATTGTVTGSWETTGIGVDQPAGNTPAPLYVAVEDKAGHAAVVVHPDPLAVLAAEWQAWEISLSDLAGVNLGSIATLTIGVGDPDNPTGAVGQVYIDDIGFGRPAAAE